MNLLQNYIPNIIIDLLMASAMLTLFLLPDIALGQGDKPSPVQFHGSNTLVGQYSNMQAIGSEIPPSFFRNDMQMTLSVYGVPISASFFITSMERDYRQSINNFRIRFDAREMLKNKGLGSGKDIISSVALYKLQNLEKVKDGLMKSTDLLNTDILNNLNEIKLLQQGYEEAKKELEITKLTKGKEEVEQAKVKVSEAKAKLDKVKDSYEKAKIKLVEAKAKIDDTMAKLEKAKAKVEEVKSLIFDSGAAKRKAETLAKKSVMGGFTRFLSNFTTLEIGKCRPNYSELTLKGIPVSGVNIEFTPGKLYMAFSTGKTLRPIKPTDSLVKPVYEQKILFGKLGFGKKQGTHFYLTYMQIEDQMNSLPLPVEQDTTPLRPKSNHVIGSELKFVFFEKKLTIEGEGAVSMLTRDTQSPTIDVENSVVPSWISNFTKPNMSSSVDYAYKIKTRLNLKTTKITGGMSMIGPGFSTLGNPNLRNDRLSYQGRIDQSFAKRQLSVSVFYRQHNDNLINWKTAKSTVVAYGVNVGFRFKKVPYLQVGYMPNFMNTASDSIKLENSIYLITATSGYNYKIGELRSNTSFSFFYQNSETLMDTVKNTSKNQTYTLNQQLTFKVPLSIAAGISYSKSEFSTQKRDIIMLTLSSTLSAFKSRWQNTVGVKYSNQNYEQYKLGFFLNSRAKLGKKFDFQIKIENNIYRENCIVANNFNEFIATSTLTMKW